MAGYKVPWHIRQYVKQELMDYKKNRTLVKSFKGNTRTLILIEKRLSQIETVLTQLNEEDRQAAKAIFIDHYTQAGAEVTLHITKAMYYNAMNKVIYLVAKEMNLI